MLVKVFVKFLEQQRLDQGIWSILKRKGCTCIMCQGFYAFMAIPEQVVELRTAVAPLGCLKGHVSCPLDGPWHCSSVMSLNTPDWVCVKTRQPPLSWNGGVLGTVIKKEKRERKDLRLRCRLCDRRLVTLQ